MKRAGAPARPIAVVAVLFAVFALAFVPAAHAQVAVQKTGWWTRSPSPPAVPQGGLAVGEAPDGNLTVSAFQIDAGGGASNVTLSVGFSDGQGAQAASVQVCTTNDGWAQVDGGDLALAPRPTCPEQAVLLTADSNNVWSGDISSVLAGKTGVVSVMLVPGPDAAALPGGARTGAFQISFAPPTLTGTVTPAPTSSSDESAAPVTDTTPDTTFSPAYGAPLATPTPQVSLNGASPPSSMLSAAGPEPGSANVNFPVRVSGTPQKRAKSRVVILGWVALAIVAGALAALWHYARDVGTLDRLLPLRSGGGLLSPPPE